MPSLADALDATIASSASTLCNKTGASTSNSKNASMEVRVVCPSEVGGVQDTNSAPYNSQTKPLYKVHMQSQDPASSSCSLKAFQQPQDECTQSSQLQQHQRYAVQCLQQPGAVAATAHPTARPVSAHTNAAGSGYSNRQPAALCGNFKSQFSYINPSTTSSSSFHQHSGQQLHDGQGSQGPVQTMQGAAVPVNSFIKAAATKSGISSADNGLTGKLQHVNQQASNFRQAKQSYAGSGGIAFQHQQYSHQQYRAQASQMDQQQHTVAAQARGTTGTYPGQLAAAPIMEPDFSKHQLQIQATFSRKLSAALQEASAAATAGAAAVSATASQDSSNTRWMENIPSQDLECCEDLALFCSYSADFQLSADEDMEYDVCEVFDISSRKISIGYASSRARLDFAKMSIYTDMHSPQALAESNLIMQGLQLPGKQGNRPEGLLIVSCVFNPIANCSHIHHCKCCLSRFRKMASL